MDSISPVSSPVGTPVTSVVDEGVDTILGSVEDWILEDGTWDDTKYWRDGAEWKDS